MAAAPSRSLAGRAILLTQEDAGELSAVLRAAGAEIRHVPLTRTLPPLDPRPLHRAAARLSDFPWVALTSARAVEALVNALVEVRGLAAESDTAGPRWACVGQATAEALRARLGIEADLVPVAPSAAALAEALLNLHQPKRVLFPAAENARPDLPDRLRAAGIDVVQVCAYRTVASTPDPNTLTPPDGHDRWDAVVLTSGAAVISLRRTLASRGQENARRWLIENPTAILGASAEAALRAEGIAPAIRAARPTVRDIAEAIFNALAL